jgi:hypothetical protein
MSATADRRIPDELIERARAVDLLTEAQRLGAKLKHVGGGEHVGPCVVCSGRDRFSVNVRKRVWFCRYCGKGGSDALSLVAHARGLDLREADDFREAIRSLIGEEEEPKRPQPDDGNVARNLRSAARLVAELVPVRGTPGERYFHELREIDVKAIADVLERTDAIGWHPEVHFHQPDPEQPHHGHHAQKLGAIIAIMTDPITAKPTGAISRTYLAPDLTKIGKAKTLGSPAGIVRLSLDEDVLSGLHLAEGLETALDAMAKGFRPTWSTGSTALMAKFPVLVGIEALTIFADHDHNGAGQRAASEAASRWLAAGREAHIYQRETPGDLNDAFREASR